MEYIKKYLLILLYITIIPKYKCINYTKRDIILTPFRQNVQEGRTIYFNPNHFDTTNTIDGKSYSSSSAVTAPNTTTSAKPWEYLLKYLMYLVINQKTDGNFNSSDYFDKEMILMSKYQPLFSDNEIQIFGDIITVAKGCLDINDKNDGLIFLELRHDTKCSHLNCNETILDNFHRPSEYENTIGFWLIEKIRHRTNNNILDGDNEKYEYELKITINLLNITEILNINDNLNEKQIWKIFLLKQIDYPIYFNKINRFIDEQYNAKLDAPDTAIERRTFDLLNILKPLTNTFNHNNNNNNNNNRINRMPYYNRKPINYILNSGEYYPSSLKYPNQKVINSNTHLATLLPYHETTDYIHHNHHYPQQSDYLTSSPLFINHIVPPEYQSNQQKYFTSPPSVPVPVTSTDLYYQNQYGQHSAAISSNYIKFPETKQNYYHSTDTIDGTSTHPYHLPSQQHHLHHHYYLNKQQIPIVKVVNYEKEENNIYDNINEYQHQQHHHHHQQAHHFPATDDSTTIYQPETQYITQHNHPQHYKLQLTTPTIKHYQHIEPTTLQYMTPPQLFKPIIDHQPFHYSEENHSRFNANKLTTITAANEYETTIRYSELDPIYHSSSSKSELNPSPISPPNHDQVISTKSTEQTKHNYHNLEKFGTTTTAPPHPHKSHKSPSTTSLPIHQYTVENHLIKHNISTSDNDDDIDYINDNVDGKPSDYPDSINAQLPQPDGEMDYQDITVPYVDTSSITQKAILQPNITPSSTDVLRKINYNTSKTTTVDDDDLVRNFSETNRRRSTGTFIKITTQKPIIKWMPKRMLYGKNQSNESISTTAPTITTPYTALLPTSTETQAITTTTEKLLIVTPINNTPTDYVSGDDEDTVPRTKQSVSTSISVKIGDESETIFRPTTFLPNIEMIKAKLESIRTNITNLHLYKAIENQNQTINQINQQLSPV